ncbi:recQ-mediated genome instability protein 1 [Coemansia sp. RSA 2530]|nr:recQ-mediated genome instability protein 1 [Coemansia sp. RSA 2530]
MVDRAGVSATIKKRYGAALRAQWLEKCAAHIEQALRELEETAGSRRPVHLETQVRLVAEQLVHSEISDSCFPSLVVEAGTQHVKELAGHPGVFLQVQSVVDVGVSKYAVWEAAREKEDFEQRGIRPSYLPQLTDEDDSGSGEANSTAATQAEASGDSHPKIPRKMLKLVLTDGQRHVSALEVEPIAQLSAELAIGSKVVVTGAQTVAGTGVLCLRAGNIRVVGGAPAQYAQQTLRARMAELLGLEDRRGT